MTFSSTWRSSFARHTSVLVAVAAMAISACGGSSDSSQGSNSHRTKNAALTVPVTGCVTTKSCKPGDIGPAGGVILSVANDASCGSNCFYTEVAPDKWGDTLTINCDGTTRTAGTGAVTIDPRCELAQARKIIANYTGGSTCNWFLPSTDQLATFTTSAVPGLQSNYYWAEGLSFYLADPPGPGYVGWGYSYRGKFAGNVLETKPLYVRPIRTYSTESLKKQTPCTNAASAPSTTYAPPVTVTIPYTPTTVKPTTTTSSTTTTTTTLPPVKLGAPCPTPTTCQVGNIGPGGGTIFYVSATPFTLVGGDSTTCATKCRYLEAAPSTWYKSGFDPILTIIGNGLKGPATGSFATSIGSGLTNTTAAIAKVSSDAKLAAGAARAYRGGNLKDWFLPSKDEMAQMYKNKTLLKLNTKITKNVEYWTSTGVPAKTQYPTQFIAIDLDANGVTFAAPGDTNARYVRPIRAS